LVIHVSLSQTLPLDAYLEAALQGDQTRCMALAQQAIADGVPIKRLYLDVFQAAQRRVGELWAANAISVGTEHRATGVTQAVIASLYEHIVCVDGHGRKLLLGVVGRERHQVGPRMVADFAEMAGYDVTYMGVIPDPDALVKAVLDTRPENVGLSATLPVHLPEIARYIRALREALQDACPRIVVGGRAFSIDPDAWRRVGADCHASDAEEAISCLDAEGGAGE
jgi:methanogenic corrinoid protein MtbC1